MKDEIFADIEPVAGVLRVFERGSVPGVDPYIFSATVVYHDNGKTVEFKGVTSDGTSFVKLRHAIFKALWISGVDKVIWDRVKNGQRRRIIIDLHSFFKRS
jgi:hypothetical protein